MRYYFVRSHEGIGQTTQGDELSVVEALRTASLSEHLDDWHSPIYEVADDMLIREAPVAVVFVGDRDVYLYSDGHFGDME